MQHKMILLLVGLTVFAVGFYTQFLSIKLWVASAKRVDFSRPREDAMRGGENFSPPRVSSSRGREISTRFARALARSI